MRYASFVACVVAALPACSPRRVGLEAYPTPCGVNARTPVGCVQRPPVTWNPSNASIQYPELMADAGMDGYVLGELLINSAGQVDSLHIRRFTNALLVGPLRTAVRSWQFGLPKPAKTGRPFVRTPLEARFRIICGPTPSVSAGVSRIDVGWRVDVVAECRSHRRRIPEWWP